MSIDRLSSTSSLIAALRSQMARKGERASTPARTGEPGKHAATRDSQALRRELVELVRGIDVDDPDAMQAARRRVIRAVLLLEFGSDLREYGEWQPMVDTLYATLEGSEIHRVEFVKFVRSVK
jgi:hypothetical protein